MSITIREKTSGVTLASGETPAEVVPYEGNYYFAPSAVAQDALTITSKTYTCPFKGVCHYVDYTGPDGATAKDVAWVYAEPKPGHEVIKGRYGFYAGSRGATKQD
jgi:uncharacterized protein (DUF427 family)